MRPNFFHSASSSSSSVSWQQQQQRNKEILAQFPYNMESSSSTHLNSSEGDEIDDHVVLGGRGLDLSEGVQKGGGLIISTTPLEKEHMFDKVVTPSDVGKLNRLVIPKQHAEKYFPLDSSTNEKGLLLNFEDRIGKPWRFRYSYWNSSQSYVMTKGWSRFVKDKKLDAGDIVSFSRGVGQLEKDRFFIDWRRRPTAPPLPLPPPPPHPSSSFLPGHQYFSNFHHPCFLQLQRCRDHPTNLHQINAVDPHHSTGYGLMNNENPFPGSLIYFRSPIQATISPASGVGGIGMMQVQTRTSGAITDEDDPMVFESVPVVQGKAAAKRLRLFGVNMDCPISEVSDLSGPDIILPSTAVSNSNPPPPPTGNFYSSSSSSSMWTPLPRKMFSDDKGKGSLSLDFDI